MVVKIEGKTFGTNQQPVVPTLRTRVFRGISQGCDDSPHTMTGRKLKNSNAKGLSGCHCNSPQESAPSPESRHEGGTSCGPPSVGGVL